MFVQKYFLDEDEYEILLKNWRYLALKGKVLRKSGHLFLSVQVPAKEKSKHHY